MYKRVIALIGALVAVVAMTVIPVSASETNYIEDYVYTNNDNIIVWNYAPDVLIEDQIMFENDGLMYITADGQSAQYGDLATFTVTKERYSTCMIYVDYYSDFPADAGFRYFDISIGVDDRSFVLDGMAGEEVLEIEVQQGSTITIGIEWGMESGQTYDDYSVYISCHPYVSSPSSIRPDYTVPWLWLQSLSADNSDLYQEGYESGFTDGYDEGYDVGYTDGVNSLDNLTYGVFSTAQFTAILTGSDPSSGASYTHSIEFAPNFMYSGVFFSGLYDLIDTYLGSTFGDNVTGWEYVDRVEIQMTWSDANVFDYQILPLFISGDMDVNYGQIYTTSGNSYAVNAVAGTSGNRRELVVDTTSVDPILVNKTVIRVGRPADLLTAFTLYSPDESYNEGYTEGYGIGYHEGHDVGWQVGSVDGYDIGFAAGKTEGLEISKNGDWRNLMLAVVEAPVNTFQSLFNFEILGLDMRKAMGAILAVCVFLIIIKVVMFK